MRLINVDNFYNLSYEIRNINIPSRFFFAPINTGFTDKGQPTEELIQFHSRRSGNSIGVSFVGNVAIRNDFITNGKTAYFTLAGFNNWRKLSEKIKQNGSIPGIQIGCRYSKIKPIKSWVNPDPQNYIKLAREEISNIPKKDFSVIVQIFVAAAEFASKAGFEVLQIHSAHGYFLSRLMNRILNIRTDEFASNRVLLWDTIINSIRQKTPNVLIDIRFSLLDGLETEIEEIDYKSKFIEEIAQLDVDIISISNGIYDLNKDYIYPPLDWGHGVFINNIIPFAEHYPDKIWNTVGNIYDIRKIDVSIPPNVTFSIGRSLIADPKFIYKSLMGNFDKIRECTRCDDCHYYSKGKNNIVCH